MTVTVNAATTGVRGDDTSIVMVSLMITMIIMMPVQ